MYKTELETNVMITVCFMSTYRGILVHLPVYIENVKALVGAFNQEKALVGALSVITNLRICFGCNFLKH